MMRKTKIVATLGPATDAPETIARLLDAGVNIARLNMSHAKHDWVRQVVKHLRNAAQARGQHVGILIDTQGPAVRTGDVPAPIELRRGEPFTFTVGGAAAVGQNSVSVNYDNFINDISVGDVVLIDNGEIEMKVVAKGAGRVECQVLTPGKLGSRRHINLPGVKVSLPALTEKDRADLELALEVRVDYVALSFVREAKDLQELRAILARSETPPLIVAKIEGQQAVNNLEELVRYADAVMVARGDLGIECPYEELPIIQRKVVKSCLRIGRPVIVATHMLESMISSPMPTRAEITDVSNAVFEQADAIMLSGETTIGKYPLRCVEVFDRIARRTERSGGAGYQAAAELVTAREKLVKSAVVMADELKAQAIFVFARDTSLARYTAWMRPKVSPIYAACPNERMACSLTLNRAITPMVIDFDDHDPDRTVTTGLRHLRDDGHLQPGDTVVVVGATSADRQIVDARECAQRVDYSFTLVAVTRAIDCHQSIR